MTADSVAALLRMWGDDQRDGGAQAQHSRRAQSPARRHVRPVVRPQVDARQPDHRGHGHAGAHQCRAGSPGRGPPRATTTAIAIQIVEYAAWPLGKLEPLVSVRPPEGRGRVDAGSWPGSTATHPNSTTPDTSEASARRNGAGRPGPPAPRAATAAIWITGNAPRVGDHLEPRRSATPVRRSVGHRHSSRSSAGVKSPAAVDEHLGVEREHVQAHAAARPGWW